jgi:hypothetical protein
MAKVVECLPSKFQTFSSISSIEWGQRRGQENFQTEFNNTLKRSYTMIKLILLQGYKKGSTYTNK